MLSRALVKPTLWGAALAALCAASSALASAAAAQDGGGCAKDTECKGSRICVNRACVDPAPVVACARDVDCPGDELCVEKVCASAAAAVAGASAPAKGAGSASKKKGAASPAAVSPAPAPAAPAPVAQAPASVSAPVEMPTVLIIASPPPAVTTPPAATPPPPAPAPAPAFSPPATPPLSAAPASAGGSPLIRRVEEPGFSPSWLYNIGAQAGFHLWRSDPSSAVHCPGTKSPPPCYEGDFGLALSGEAGVRISDHFGLSLLGAGTWTLMASSDATLFAPAVSYNALLASIGTGLRVDHLGALPGHFMVGGAATFGAIVSGSDAVAAINLSGLSALLSYALPLNGALQADGRVTWHVLNKDFSLLVLSVGISFGN